MRVCLKCGAEYLDDRPQCADCLAPTQTPSEQQKWLEERAELTTQEFVQIHVLESPVDKAVLPQLLHDEGIPCLVHDHRGDNLSIMFQSQQGYGTLMVLEDSVDRAREVIAMYNEAVIPEPGSDEEAELEELELDEA